jgi:hypothetical protein
MSSFLDKDAQKQLRIKFGSVKRTKKEFDFYVKEEGEQRTKIDAMKAEGRAEHDIKQVLECLNETLTVRVASSRCWRASTSTG